MEITNPILILNHMFVILNLMSMHYCLTGKLVDVTKNYKYMYTCCGCVVIFASIWLFIGNFINYRLLEKERNQETYKQAELEEPDREADCTDDGQVSEELCGKVGDVVQRETNI